MQWIEYDLKKYQSLNLEMAADGFHPSKEIYSNMGAGSGGQNPPEILNSPLLAEKAFLQIYLAENRPAKFKRIQ